MKKLIALMLVLVMVLGLAACGTEKGSEASTPAAQEQTGSTGEEPMHFTVTVVHSDGSSKYFEYQTSEEFLGPVLVQEGLIQGVDGPYGLEIIEVDGETAIYETSKAYWALYVNGEYALQGIDTTLVEDGVAYKLEYTRG